MTPETQEKLIELAQRGAKCEAWAEWCLKRLVKRKGDTQLEVRITGDFNLYFWIDIGPLPSSTYLDDQLGDFLERAGVKTANRGFLISLEDDWMGRDLLVWDGESGPNVIDPIDKLEAAVTLAERAHRLGEYAHYTETEAAPYLAAFNKGIGRC